MTVVDDMVIDFSPTLSVLLQLMSVAVQVLLLKIKGPESLGLYL